MGMQLGEGFRTRYPVPGTSSPSASAVHGLQMLTEAPGTRSYGDAHSGLVHQSLIRVPLEKGSLLKPFSKISALVPDQIRSLNSTRWQERALGAEPAPQRVARMLERCLKSSLLLVSRGLDSFVPCSILQNEGDV